jgi:D-glycero-D-manno-heptose 1,7-bisphosphate phosphatase
VTRAVFIDRDGVLNELVADASTGNPESPLDPQQVELVPGAGDALRRLHDAGYLIIGVSNQPAAAKGIADIEQLESVQARVLDLLERAGGSPDAFYVCLHHPEGVVPGLGRRCDCRKPAPGMLLDAAAELDIDLSSSWMVGDTDTDIAAGRAAGSRTILIENPASAHKRSGSAHPGATAPDLAAAADLILSTKDDGSGRR